MRENSPVRLGVIGAGYIAGVHADAASAIPEEVRFVAVADTNHQAASALAERYGIGSSYGDVAEMLREQDLDCVIIATWPSTHLDLIRKCVVAGVKNILCEKPFVLTGDEALEVWSLADKTGASITEAFMYRYHPALTRIDDMLGTEEIGSIDHVRASFTYVHEAVGFAPDDPNRPWRFQAEQGGGALYDIGAYAVNACTHVAGALPQRVVAFGHATSRFGTSDKVLGLIDYENDIVGVLEASEVSDSTQELQVSGKRGTLYLPFTWTIYDETEISVRRSVPPPHRDPSRIFRTLDDRVAVPRSNAFQDQLSYVAKVVRGEISPLVTLAETVVNTITIDALMKSLKQREAVDVTIPEDVAAAFPVRSAAQITT